MYQPYPSHPAQASPPGSAPAPVRYAVCLMYAGAVVYVISGIVGLIYLATAAPGIADSVHFPSRSPVPGAAARALTVADLVMGIVSIVIPVVLWLWMAWKCKAGRRWARIVSTVLFALSTLLSVTAGVTGLWGLLGEAVGWLFGLAAVILLWQRSSSWYFRTAPRY